MTWSCILRPGGHLLAEIITRHAWVMGATLSGLLGVAEIWEDFDWLLRTGQSMDPDKFIAGGFWAYFHHPDELVTELELAGFRDIQLLAVEGFAWLLGDLSQRVSDPAELLRALRLTETEPSMLGASAHVIAAARRH